MTFRRSTEDIDLGFGRYAYDSEHHNRPKVQIIASKQPPPEDRVHYCSTCNGKLQWLEQNRKFICYKCSVTYSETDTPLASILNSIKPLQSTDPYERIEPAMVSRKIDSRLQGDPINKHIQVSGNMRRARIHVDGSPLLVTEDLIRKALGEDEVYGRY